MSYGAVNDAEAQKNAALEAYNKADDAVTAAMEALNDASSDVKDLGTQISGLLAQELDVNSKYAVAYNQWKDKNAEVEDITSNRNSLLESIGQYADVPEEAKKELSELLSAWSKAEGAYLAKQNEIDAADAKVLDFQIKKENSETINKLAKAFVEKISVSGDWFSDLKNFSTSENIQKKFFEYAGAESEVEKQLLFEYVAGLYTYLTTTDVVKDNYSAAVNSTPIKDLNSFSTDAEAYRTEIVEVDIAKYTEEYNNAVAEQTALEAEVDYIAEQLSALSPKVEILKGEKEQAEKDYKSKQDELGIYENALASWREELEGVEKDLAAATTEANNLKTEYEGYRNQLMDLNKQINDLDDQLKGLEWNESIAEYNFRKAMWACDMAASNYIHLNNFYESVKAQRAYNWLSLKTDDNRYLMVDTAYLEDEPEESTYSHLKFGLKAYKAIEETHPGIAEMNKRDINGRFNFRFLYYPTQDSLHIEADGYNQKFVTTENWVDRSNWEINKIATPVLGMEQNLV